MATTMHRLQISLPEWQYRYLATLARRRGVSIAEMVRRLVAEEAENEPSDGAADSLWEIAGIAEDREPLVDSTPVSERPELYLRAGGSRGGDR